MLLFFKQTALVLRKNSLSKLKYFQGSFSKVIESGESLILFKKFGTSVFRFCFREQGRMHYFLPEGVCLVDVVSCAKKRFIAAVVSSINGPNKSSLIFWIWDNEDYLFAVESQKKLEKVSLFSDTELLVTHKSGFQIFDNLQMSFTRKFNFEWDLDQVFLRGENEVMLQFKTRGLYLFNMDTKQKQKIASLTKKILQVYLSERQELWEVSDVNNLVQVNI